MPQSVYGPEDWVGVLFLPVALSDSRCQRHRRRLRRGRGGGAKKEEAYSAYNTPRPGLNAEVE